MSEVSSERVLPEHQSEEDWKQQLYAEEPPADADGGAAVTLEGTLNVVKENIWSLGDAALKSVAEVLVGFGISPTILGYSEEELLEEEEALEDARQRIQKDEVVAKTSFARRNEENMSRRRTEEGQQPEEPEEEEVYIQDRTVSWVSAVDSLEGEGFGEDKKDK